MNLQIQWSTIQNYHDTVFKEGSFAAQNCLHKPFSWYIVLSYVLHKLFVLSLFCHNKNFINQKGKDRNCFILLKVS